jgi:hypothetical protein
MHSPFTTKKSLPLLAILVLLTCILFTGCASFPGKNLPDRTFVDLAPEPEDPAKKLCLVTPDMSTISEADRELYAVSVAMLEKSGLFLKVPEHGTPSGQPTQKHIKLDFRPEFKAGDIAVAVISGIVSGLTLTIVPAYARDSFVLTVQIRLGEELVKESVYREQMNTWIHLSMLFMLPEHWPRNVIGEIYDRSIMNFLYDYSHDMETRSLLANVP